MAYNENGDLLASEGQAFRQVGWQINGGDNDKVLVPMNDEHMVETLAIPHGGFSPIYVEVGV